MGKIKSIIGSGLATTMCVSHFPKFAVKCTLARHVKIYILLLLVFIPLQCMIIMVNALIHYNWPHKYTGCIDTIIITVIILTHTTDAPEVTALNSSTHNVVLAEELRLQCSLVGVPAPSVFWFHNDEPLSDRVNGVIINNNLANDRISTMIRSGGRKSGGTYACRANNTLGTDQKSYTVRIVPGKQVN